MSEHEIADSDGRTCGVLAGRGGKIRSYRDLPVWQAAMDLAVRVYATTVPCPQAEQFGLVRQMRKAAASIPSNIAEGHRRRGVRAFLASLSIAAGSHAELETHVELAARVGVLSQEDLAGLSPSLTSVGRQLTALTRALRDRE